MFYNEQIITFQQVCFLRFPVLEWNWCCLLQLSWDLDQMKAWVWIAKQSLSNGAKSNWYSMPAINVPVPGNMVWDTNFLLIMYICYTDICILFLCWFESLYVQASTCHKDSVDFFFLKRKGASSLFSIHPENYHWILVVLLLYFWYCIKYFWYC